MNDVQLLKLTRLLRYSDRYEISIQFWPEQTAVFIAKDGVDLKDYGGDFDFAFDKSIEYLDRITGNKNKPTITEGNVEDAANDYADKHAFRVPYDGTNNFYDDKDFECSKESFIAGAQWQASQVSIEDK